LLLRDAEYASLFEKIGVTQFLLQRYHLARPDDPLQCLASAVNETSVFLQWRHRKHCAKAWADPRLWADELPTYDLPGRVFIHWLR